MRVRQASVLEALRSLQTFFDTNDDILDELNRSGARRTLDRAVNQLTTHAVDQDAGRINSLGETARQRVLRKVLREHHMRAIAAVACAKLRDLPEFGALRLPHRRATNARLIAAAGAMAEAATPHTAIFIECGLRDDFVARLLAAATQLEESIDLRARSRGRRVGATAGLLMEEQRGKHLVRILDALVVPALGTHEHLLAEWRALKRIAAKPGPARETTEASAEPNLTLRVVAAS